MKSYTSSDRDNDQRKNLNQSQNDSIQLKQKVATEIEAPFGGAAKNWQQIANNSPQAIAQKKARDSYNNSSLMNTPVAQKKKNNTGLPDNLKSGIENLSGIDMSDTKVSYNSSKPADVGAHAYAQGSDIHVASGQEKHLAHEAWHIVQQKQNRVKPTTTQNGVAINDDTSLETEADVMGAKAATLGSTLQAKAIQKMPEEEEMQLKTIQKMPEEEEMQLKTIQKMPEEEEMQLKTIQKMPEEEEMQLKTIQKMANEDEMQLKPIQRAERKKKKPRQMKAIQRAVSKKKKPKKM